MESGENERSLFINTRKPGETMVDWKIKEVMRKYDLHGSGKLCHSMGGHTLPPVDGSLCEKQPDNCAPCDPCHSVPAHLCHP